jgi:hypothetical protein
MKFFWRRLFGYKYLLNLRSKEIHKLDSVGDNCLINLMSKKNKKFIGERKVAGYINNGYNGCRWCFKIADTDMPKSKLWG